MAEIRDDDLFTQPEKSCYGDCPICCLPLPVDTHKIAFMGCCSKMICIGCNFANQKREYEAGLEMRCAFCREPLAKSVEEAEKNRIERIKKNDPAAIREMGKKNYHEKNYKSALEYLTSAAALGDAEAHCQLSILYREGDGVEKDLKKNTYHLEEAAIGGHPMARHYLGCFDARNGRFERAKKHFIIAANFGYQDSLNELRRLYSEGNASKEDYAGALRAYQASVEATKSPERKEAEEALKSRIARAFY